MNINTAPSVEEADEKECSVCEKEGTFVLYDNDKVCKHCGHAPDGGGNVVSTDEDEWENWHTHRRSEYSGFTGEDRIKFVGGFAAAYEFGDDFMNP